MPNGTLPHTWDQAFDLLGNLQWLSGLVLMVAPKPTASQIVPTSFSQHCRSYHLGIWIQYSCRAHRQIAWFRKWSQQQLSQPACFEPRRVYCRLRKTPHWRPRALVFQLPIDDAVPCTFFAGAIGIASFPSFWQSRAGKWRRISCILV